MLLGLHLYKHLKNSEYMQECANVGLEPLRVIRQANIRVHISNFKLQNSRHCIKFSDQVPKHVGLSKYTF